MKNHASHRSKKVIKCKKTKTQSRGWRSEGWLTRLWEYTCHDEHRVVYKSVELLDCKPKMNITLYVN